MSLYEADVSRGSYLADLCELLIILEEEAQVLICNIDLRISSQPPMLFFRLLTTRESMLIDLILQLIRSIRHEDTRVDITGAHLGLRPLESREEFGMDERGLGILEFLSNVACQTEVRILVDGAGNETWDVRCGSEYLRE
jgi:hypothetical protein